MQKRTAIEQGLKKDRFSRPRRWTVLLLLPLRTRLETLSEKKIHVALPAACRCS